MESSLEIAANFRRAGERIASAAQSAGRDPAEIKLVVVTKGQPVDRIRAVLAAGAECLGENYVEEALEKMQLLSGEARVEWRMIGHLQSRKARQVVENFQALDSLDSLKLAQRLDRFALELGCRLPVLLEFNLSGEQSKSGWPAWDETTWPALGDEIAPLTELACLDIQGLMTMPPYFDQPELAAPYFRKLHQLQSFLKVQLPQLIGRELSMGMSGDFEVAVREGATMVRIGTAIMGSRRLD